MKLWSRFIHYFWLWTILGVLWAWWIPEHFTWFITTNVYDYKLVNLGLGVIMLGMGMTLSFEDFRKVLAHPRVIAIGAGAQFLLMPLLGWLVATLFALPPMLALGVILVSCCPGGTASNVVCFLARANVALSVLMTMSSTLLAVALTPLLTKLYAGAILEVDALAMLKSMVSIVLVPVFFGVLLNQYAGPRLRTLKAVSPVLSILLIVWIVGGVVGLSKAAIWEHRMTLLPAVFTLHAAGFVLAYFWARWLKLGELECHTVSIEVGMQNSGLGASLARTHFTALAATPCAISAVYHCLMGSLLAAYWQKKLGKAEVQDSDSKSI